MDFGVALLSSVGLLLMIVLGGFNAGITSQFEETSKVLGVVEITEANLQVQKDNYLHK